jgi:DNA polymerase lambda
VKREALIIDPKLDIEIMGSYRRGAENSGDVDFLITRNDGDGLNHSGVIEKLVRKLMYMGVITHEVSQVLVYQEWIVLMNS